VFDAVLLYASVMPTSMKMDAPPTAFVVAGVNAAAVVPPANATVSRKVDAVPGTVVTTFESTLLAVTAVELASVGAIAYALK